MAKLAPQEWNFASFDNFSDWSDKLGDAHTVTTSNNVSELSLYSRSVLSEVLLSTVVV
jgi:hypothetical protein